MSRWDAGMCGTDWMGCGGVIYGQYFSLQIACAVTLNLFLYSTVYTHWSRHLTRLQIPLIYKTAKNFDSFCLHGENLTDTSSYAVTTHHGSLIPSFSFKDPLTSTFNHRWSSVRLCFLWKDLLHLYCALLFDSGWAYTIVYLSISPCEFLLYLFFFSLGPSGMCVVCVWVNLWMWCTASSLLQQHWQRCNFFTFCTGGSGFFIVCNIVSIKLWFF